MLFKPLKDAASLLVCNEKNFWFWVSGFIVGDVLSRSGLWTFRLKLLGHGSNHKREIFLKVFIGK